MSFSEWLISELIGDGILDEDFDEEITKDSLEDEYDISGEEFDDFKSHYAEYCESMGLDPDFDVVE